jgi:site-specific DNA-methyltransferase (adenine-specific)
MDDIILADRLDLLSSLPAESTQVVIADPRYGIAYHSNRYEDKNPHSPIAQDWNFQISTFLEAAERCLRPGGAVYLFTRFDVYPLWAQEIPPSLSLRNMIIWDNGN